MGKVVKVNFLAMFGLINYFLEANISSEVFSKCVKIGINENCDFFTLLCLFLFKIFEKIDIFDSLLLGMIVNRFIPDKVLHLAAQAGVRYSVSHPETYADSNLKGFLNILEVCRSNKVKHLVYASSSSVYGGNTKYPYDESDPVDHPISLYAATKKANELILEILKVI